MEHWESLCPGGYRFVYGDALFPPGTDTFLLSSLPRLRPGLRVCDLGAGTGLLGLLLLQRQPQLRVTGVELQESAVRLAERAAVENCLTDCLFPLHGDLRQIRSLLGTGSFDLVVSNPPYYAPGQRCSGGGRPPAKCPRRGLLHAGGGLSGGSLSAALGRQLLRGAQARSG